ncbi:MAG: hypothetical protein M3271_07940 [Actinomycetota bacterium]|nr:hypothetical protein [Actinomycetota bacterium]
MTAISVRAAQGGISEEEALYRSLASCGAALIAFVGVAHEAVGDNLFPWGPGLLGGSVGWHGTGLLVIALGLLLLGGTLRLYRFPVVPLALSAAALAAFFVVFAAVRHRQFHMFALAGFLAGIVTAYFHRKALQRGVPVAASSHGGTQ